MASPNCWHSYNWKEHFDPASPICRDKKYFWSCSNRKRKLRVLHRKDTFKFKITLDRHKAIQNLNYYDLPATPNFWLPSTFNGSVCDLFSSWLCSTWVWIRCSALMRIRSFDADPAFYSDGGSGGYSFLKWCESGSKSKFATTIWEYNIFFCVAVTYRLQNSIISYKLEPER